MKKKCEIRNSESVKPRSNYFRKRLKVTTLFFFLSFLPYPSIQMREAFKQTTLNNASKSEKIRVKSQNISS